VLRPSTSPEHEGAAVGLGQGVDGALEQHAQLAGQGLLLGVGLLGDQSCHLALIGPVGLARRLELLAAADPGQRFIDGDPGEPGGELGPAGELREVRVGVDIGLLHDVLGLPLVLHDRAGDTVDPWIVAPHQDLEEGDLAPEDAVYDLLVPQPVLRVAEPFLAEQVHSFLHLQP
jgi:hypothetical protein